MFEFSHCGYPQCNEGMAVALLLCYLVLCVYVTHASARATNMMKIEVNPDEERCIGQQLDEEDAALFSFSAANPHDSTMKLKPQLYATIKDPDDELLLTRESVTLGARSKDHKIDKIKVRGVHNLCFTVENSEKPVTVSFLIDFIGHEHAAELLGSTASRVEKGDISMLEANLKQAEETLESISDEIEFAKKQEQALKEAGELANTRIEMFSYFSMAVLLVTSVYQLLYLRSFFRSKKLL